MDSKGISDIFFYVSDDKVYAFNVKTASEGVIIDGTKEHYAIDGVDCTEELLRRQRIRCYHDTVDYSH